MNSSTGKYKKIIVPIILKHLPQAKIILYGSRARHDDKQGSDIDIAIDIGRKISDHIISAIKSDIDESSLPIHYDIVDFHGVSERMQKEILKDGEQWQK